MTELQVAGERLLLYPERAAYWPREATLLVADAHFGKAAAFRASGVPVPRGTTQEALVRLDAALARERVRRIVFLGDFLHARAARAPATLAALRAWRERHAEVTLTLVRGNHDRHAGAPPAQLGIDSLGEPSVFAPFALCHEPCERIEGFVLAGHLHPAIVLRGRGRARLRAPCFVFGERFGVLPAFGAFTGTWVVPRRAGERIFVIADDQVLPVPAW